MFSYVEALLFVHHTPLHRKKQHDIPVQLEKSAWVHAYANCISDHS